MHPSRLLSFPPPLRKYLPLQSTPRLQVTAHEQFLAKRNYAYWVGRIHYKKKGARDHQRYVLDQCGRKMRKKEDPRAGLMSINGGGTDSMTVS